MQPSETFRLIAWLTACVIPQWIIGCEDFLFENMGLNELIIGGSLCIQFKVVSALLKSSPSINRICIAGFLGIIPALASSIWLIQSVINHSSFYDNKTLVTFREFGKETVLVFLEETEADPNIVVFSRTEGTLVPIRYIQRIGRYIRMDSASWKPSAQAALEIYNGRRSVTLRFSSQGELIK